MSIRVLVILFFALIIGLSACKKNNDAPTVAVSSGLNIINASTDTVNFYLNGTRLNNNSNLYPLFSSGYIGVISGQQNFQVKKIFNPVTSIVQPLFNITIPLDTGRFYSLFIAGETAAQAFSTLDDLRSDTLANTCLVRFVNASTDAGSLNLSINNTVVSQNIAFKSASPFVQIKIGLVKQSFKVFQPGSVTPLVSDSLLFSAGNSYTLYSQGKIKGTGNSAFTVISMLNFSN
ncbi:MAG: hypothetical protein JWP37_2032 [Mucilaginibacter sp.]|nr:hypothetical protein [Mucilaginibacter sp.]